MSHLKKRLEEGKKVITTELTPPRGSGTKKLLDLAQLLKPYVTAMNITDNQRGVMRMSPIATSALLMQNGIEPVCQIACRDRNRMALQSDLLGADALGIQNILALTGDPVQGGDNPDAKKVFEFESVKLLKMLSQFQQGVAWNERKLNKKTDFFLGATANPSSPNQDTQMRRMEEKMEAGARFIQTQAVFDKNILEKFLKRVEKFGIPILPSVIMIKSPGTADFLNERVLGISVPPEIIKKMHETKSPEETGVSLAAELVKDFLEMCPGVHIIAVRREHRVPDILKQAGFPWKN